MTYFECTSCEARLYSVTGPDGLARDLCPGCGTMLAAVGELVEALGYRTIADRSLGLTLAPFRAAPTEGLRG
jgi:hypothetical protein